MTEAVWYALRNSVFERDFPAAEKLLSENPSLVNARDGLGETVLHFLAVENDLEGVSWLHARGFSLDERNKFGTPTVFEVAQLEYRELFVWFVHNGADLSLKDGEGNDIVANLLEYGKEEMAQFVATTVRPH